MVEKEIKSSGKLLLLQIIQPFFFLLFASISYGKEKEKKIKGAEDINNVNFHEFCKGCKLMIFKSETVYMIYLRFSSTGLSYRDVK